MVLPTMQREDGAKGVAGQSVTLSQFPALSKLKRALVLTLAPSEVSNDRHTFQHPALPVSISATGSVWSETGAKYRRHACRLAAA